MDGRQVWHVLRELRAELRQVLGDQLEGIYLFGSWARGEARPGSDIDVLIVLRGEFDYADLIQRTSAVVADLSLRYDVVISRAFVSSERLAHEQSPFLLNVRREGVPV
jgi:predicted nucleotidyltransferase